MLWSVHDGIVDPALLCMNDEAWFHVSGFVNAQNNHHWDIKNPHAVHEDPLNDQTVNVRCVVSNQRIIGLIFLHEMTSEHYVTNTLEPFFQIFAEEEKQHAYVQWDNATAQTSQHSMEALCDIFGEIIITRTYGCLVLQICVSEFHPWGKLKQNVYRKNLLTPETLKNEIRSVIHSITEGELQ
jgi:hypothetical protein